MIDQTKSITLREARDKFIANLKTTSRATATILAYGKDVDQLIEFTQSIHKYDPSVIDTQDIENFKVHLKNQKYTAKSISRKVNSIKSFFRFLKTKNYLSSNPASQVSHPKYDVTPPRVLSKLEYRALRDASRDDKRMSSVIELLLQTGMRIGELAQLQAEDIDLNKKQIYIRAYESRDGRTIPMNDPAHKALKEYLEIRPQSDNRTLFLTKNGHPFLVRNIRTAIDRYFKLAGIENAKVNDLRHTFVIHQLKSGTPLTYVSKLVGHKRLSTTEKYLKLIEDKTEKDTIRLEEL